MVTFIYSLNINKVTTPINSTQVYFMESWYYPGTSNSALVIPVKISKYIVKYNLYTIFVCLNSDTYTNTRVSVCQSASCSRRASSPTRLVHHHVMPTAINGFNETLPLRE